MIRVDADTVAVQTNRGPVLVQLPGPERPVYRITRRGCSVVVTGPITVAAHEVAGRVVEQIA